MPYFFEEAVAYKFVSKLILPLLLGAAYIQKKSVRENVQQDESFLQENGKIDVNGIAWPPFDANADEDDPLEGTTQVMDPPLTSKGTAHFKSGKDCSRFCMCVVSLAKMLRTF